MSETEQPAALPPPADDEKRYGQTSYHYWHDHGKERAQIGDVAPMPKPKLVSSAEPVVPSRRVVKLSKYSWSDGKKLVSIYIDIPGIGKLQDKVEASHKKRSVFLTIRYDDHDACLSLIRLNQKVKGTRLKFKDDSMVLQLEKEDAEVKWYDLHKTTVRGVGDTDSDD